MLLNRRWTEEVHHVIGLAPVANAFAGTVTSQAVSMSLWDKCQFEITKGVGATGTATITVEACSDASGSNPTAIPFTYREYITSGSDLPGAIKSATSAGFTTTAGSNQIYVIEVDQGALIASGYKYVRLKSVEVVANAVLGGINIHLTNPNYQGAAIPTTVIT